MENNDRALSWDDEIEKESEFQRIEPGEYTFTVVNLEKGQFNGSEKMGPCPMVTATLRVDVGGRNVDLKDTLYLHTKAEWRLSQYFLSLGLKKKGEKTKQRWNESMGRSGRLKTKIDQFQGREYVKIDAYLEPGTAIPVTANTAVGFAPPSFG